MRMMVRRLKGNSRGRTLLVERSLRGNHCDHLHKVIYLVRSWGEAAAEVIWRGNLARVARVQNG